MSALNPLPSDADPEATLELTPEELQEVYEAAMRDAPVLPPPTDDELNDMIRLCDPPF
jgi:hypothetical protein